MEALPGQAEESAERATTVVMRWELYRVVHDHNAALWEVGIDRTGGVWAWEAEPLETIKSANKSVAVCLGSSLTEG